MLVFASKRSMRIFLLLACLLICGSAFGQTFDDLLGSFAQRRSGVCVLYGHVLAVAEVEPASIQEMCHQVYEGWMVVFPDGRRTYVPQAEIDKSLAAGYSAGEAGNLLTIVSLGLCMRIGGYKRDTGELDYGDLDFGKYMGSGKWTGYGEGSGPDHTLACGMQRLIRETGPDGIIRTPSTIGFGLLDKQSLPKYSAEATKYHLVGGHDFSISGYNRETRCARLRNPHRPKEVIEVPIGFLLKIPCGMDFLERESVAPK